MGANTAKSVFTDGTPGSGTKLGTTRRKESLLFEKRFTFAEIVGKLLLSLLSYEFISVYIRESGLTLAGFATKLSTEEITGRNMSNGISAK